MAAKNPFKTRDLIHKYGWDILPYLSNLGVRSLAEAQVLFVDSGSANKLDADDTEHGHSFEKPLATVDYAIGLCVGSEGAIILLAPGHVEDYDDTTTGFDADVAGIEIIGLGIGSLRPRFDFNHATSKCLLGANNVQLKNVVLRPGNTTVAVGLEIASGFTGCVLEDVEFAIGESATHEFVKSLLLVSANHDTIMKNVKILAYADAAQSTHGIHIALASDRLTFKNVIINGKFSTGGIVETETGEDHIMEDCSVDVVTGTNLSFDSSSTFAKRTRNLDGGAAEDTSENLIGKNNSNNVVDTSNIVANEDGSVLERLQKIEENTDTLETAVGNIDNTVNLNTAVPVSPTSQSLQDILSKADGSNNFDKATDSLEAIADTLLLAIGDVGSPAAGSALDILKKLYYTADGGSTAYPTTIANDSALAKIMVKGTPANIDQFDNTSHSLEAIADAIGLITSSVTGVISTTPTPRSLQDILEKDGDGNFSDADDSLEMISDKVGNYNGTAGAGVNESVKASLTLAHTDLDTIIADTEMISGATLPAGGPTTNSLARFIASGGASLGQQLPANMSLIDIIGNYVGPYGGSSSGNNIKADIDLLQIDVTAILVDTGTSLEARFDTVDGYVDLIDDGTSGLVKIASDVAAILTDTQTTLENRLIQVETYTDVIDDGTSGLVKIASDVAAILTDTSATLEARLVAIENDTAAIDPGATRVHTRTITNWSLSANNALWNVSAPVRAKIWGIVLATITTQVTNLKISSTPNDPGGLVDICANLDCSADAIGTVYKMNSSFGGAMVEVTGGVAVVDGVEVILPAGIVEMGSGVAEASGGSIQWIIEYEPLVAGAVVTDT